MKTRARKIRKNGQKAMSPSVVSVMRNTNSPTPRTERRRLLHIDPALFEILLKKSAENGKK